MTKRTASSVRLLGASLLLAAGLALPGCATVNSGSESFGYPSAGAIGKLAASLPERKLPRALARTMSSKGMDRGAPIMLRIFKDEDVLEVWKRDRSGDFALLKSYEICKYSGKLGPKRREGDRQAPEGFYEVGPDQLLPTSRNHLAFNMGFPNQFDRANGRTGTFLMVHGGCTSIGCYAMTHEGIDEIYTLATDAFKGGQPKFQVQAFPFRMTPANLAAHSGDANFGFWKMLKEGADHFEVTGIPPKLGVCDRRYVFNANARLSPTASCPSLNVPTRIASAVARKESRDDRELATRVAALRGNAPDTRVASGASAADTATAFAPQASPSPAHLALDSVFSTRW